MTPRPAVLSATERLIDLLGDGLLDTDADHDWAGTLVLDAMAVNRQRFEDLFRARDGRVGFAHFLDPMTCPTDQLNALASWYGATLDDRWSIATKRMAIVDAWSRASILRIRRAASEWLAFGTITVTERYEDSPFKIAVLYSLDQLDTPTLADLAERYDTLADLAEGANRLSDIDGDEPELQSAVIGETPDWIRVDFLIEPSP